MKQGSELGKIAQGYISNGQLIPDDLMIDILAKTYDSLPAGKGVIFDGFPRTIAQAEALKKMLAERNHDMGVMIELIVDEDTLMKRLLNRAIEQGRADDNEETIKKRLVVYHSQTQPLIQWYAKEGIHYHINGLGDLDRIFADICTVIDNI
jgi:adenylate kinase